MELSHFVFEGSARRGKKGTYKGEQSGSEVIMAYLTPVAAAAEAAELITRPPVVVAVTEVGKPDPPPCPFIGPLGSTSTPVSSRDPVPMFSTVAKLDG